MHAIRNKEQVLASEREFFDEDASRLTDDDLMIAPDQMARYRDARPRAINTPKDSLFALLGDLRGKRVLEYGCGLGEDSCHLADRGARVTAFDLSPVSINKARRRAQILGLADRITFDVNAAGRLDYEPGQFDLVTGIAILHHLHSELDVIYDEVNRMLTRDGVAYFTEPVANSGFLRGMRKLVPVPTHATPDERQLAYADFERLKRHGFGCVDYFHFHCLTRLRRVLGGRVERPLRWMDHHAQRLMPFLKPTYGIILVRASR